MAEENGEIPPTGDPRVDAALERIRGKFRDIEDAMVVQAYLEKGLSRQLKDHAQLLAQLSADAERKRQEQERIETRLNELSAQTNRRVADLVSAVGKLIARG